MSYSTILVNLQAGRSNTHLLAVAKQVSERFNAGVTGHTACTPIEVMYADGYAFGDIFEQDSKEIERETNVAEAEFRDAFGNQAGFHDWHSAVVMTSLSAHLAQESSRADLILTNADGAEKYNQSRQVNIGDLVMQAGRPVLVVAPEAVPFHMDRFLIGWKDTREARRAVADALPMLQSATHVDIVEIASVDDLTAAHMRLNQVAAWLGRHGVSSRVQAVSADKEDAHRFGNVASEMRADIIVAGAYGHSRVREWALGGVTRSLLKNPVRSSLLSH